MTIRLDDKVALITGAGRGLGFAYAAMLARRGAKVVLQDTGADKDGAGTDPTVVQSAADSLRAEGAFAEPSSLSIAGRDACHHLIDSLLSMHGRLDILIHNAGWVGYRELEDLDEEFLARMMSLGAETSLWLSQAAWPAMKRQRSGRIVLTTSDRAIYPQYAQMGLSAYAASKLAVVGVANVLALEGEAYGIVVNCISPVAKTRMWGVEGEPADLRPEAVAAGVCFLASDECTQGGWVLRAANGQFHATRASEAPGVRYPHDLRAVVAAAPEDVARQWSRIAQRVQETRA